MLFRSIICGLKFGIIENNLFLSPLSSLKMSERVSQIAAQLQPKPAQTPKHPDDVVIVSALRTALTKAGKGGFKYSFADTGTRSPNLCLRVCSRVFWHRLRSTRH